MTTTSRPAAQRAPGQARRGSHPGLALAVIAGAQLMVVLDATIVNIALPHIQGALHFSTTGLSWVLNAYTLTFGGLLLLGGRAGDILGRRRVFITGILLFSLASLLGGLATSSAWLLAARALQGVGGAIASPTALALITTNFPEGRDRNRAFGVYAAVSGSGAAVGLLAGGMLTSWLSWRWVLFVNVPIGILIALAAPLYIAESERRPGRFDISGALTSTAGMVALVYGFIRAAQEGWSDPVTVGSFVAAVVLLAAFLSIETRTRQPITPLHMFRNRNRAGTYAIMLGLAAALFGMFFFLTLFVQEVLGYSPLKAGLAFLPVSAVIIVAAQVVARLLPVVGPKRFMMAGSLLATIGLAWLSRITVTTGYLDGLLGPMLVFGLGMGFLFVPLTLTAVSGVSREETGAASSLLNAMQQVGGSLGLSILVTVFGTASRNEATAQVGRFLSSATPAARAQFQRTGQLPQSVAHQVLSHGISVAFEFAVLFALVALVVSVVVIRSPSVPTGGGATQPTADTAAEAG
jgi:EmrB/QacA subfamily drug resistance transporter